MSELSHDKRDEDAIKKARSLDAWNLYTTIYEEFFSAREGKYELSPAVLLEFSDRLKAQILSVPSHERVFVVDDGHVGIEAMRKLLASDTHEQAIDVIGGTPHERAAVAALSTIPQKPLDMLLFCPRCQMQHIDAPKGDWTNPPHATHTCQGCGLLWRPSNGLTNGVELIYCAEQKHFERAAACFPKHYTASATRHIDDRADKQFVDSVALKPFDAWDARDKAGILMIAVRATDGGKQTT